MIFGNIKNKILSGALVFILCLASFFNVNASEFASDGQDKRNQVIFLLEICELDNLDSFITRAEFAKMIVKASEFKETVPEDIPTVSFEDVEITNPYCQYIKKAVKEKLMVAYLSNKFKPNEYVTYKDVSRGVLALLGYENSDFAENQTTGRVLKFMELELGKNVKKELDDFLNKQEIINVFYNLMKTSVKGSTKIYGSKFNVVKASNNELDASGVVSLSFVGPYLITHDETLEKLLPFNIDEANFYLNNVISSKMNIEDALTLSGYGIAYYNKRIKAVQVFCEGTSANVESSSVSIAVGRGYVERINENAGTYQVPYTVEINGDTFYLDAGGSQMMFSNAGGIKRNDEVVFIFEKKNNFGVLESQSASIISSVSEIKRTSSGIVLSTAQKRIYRTGDGDLYKCILGIFPIAENTTKSHFGQD